MSMGIRITESDPRSVIKGLVLGRLRVIREAMIGQHATVDMLRSIKASVHQYLRDVEATEGVDLCLDQYEVVVVSSYDKVDLDVVQVEVANAMREVAREQSQRYRYERAVV